MTRSPTDAQGFKGKRSPVLVIVFAAVMTALVYVITFSFSIPIALIAPGTVVKDQVFNAGDIAIFIAAWTFGPGIGGFAGGVGSALSDAAYGSVFAPFTLVIKGCEGLAAGYLGRRESAKKRRISWAVAGAIMMGGYFLTNLALIPLLFPSNALPTPLIGASIELPFDFLQVFAGGLIGGPVSRYLLDSLPILSSFRAQPKEQPK